MKTLASGLTLRRIRALFWAHRQARYTKYSHGNYSSHAARGQEPALLSRRRDRQPQTPGRLSLEQVGFFNPVARQERTEAKLDLPRIDYWVGQGAQPSERVRTRVRLPQQAPAASDRLTAAAEPMAARLEWLEWALGSAVRHQGLGARRVLHRSSRAAAGVSALECCSCRTASATAACSRGRAPRRRAGGAARGVEDRDRPRACRAR